MRAHLEKAPLQGASASVRDAMTTRVPLSDAENLAVGAFGGIVETCVQSAWSVASNGSISSASERQDGWDEDGDG